MRVVAVEDVRVFVLEVLDDVRLLHVLVCQLIDLRVLLVLDLVHSLEDVVVLLDQVIVLGPQVDILLANAVPVGVFILPSEVDLLRRTKMGINERVS